MQPRGAVFEDYFEHGLGLLTVEVRSERDDVPASGCRFVKLKLANRKQAPPVLVPSWRVIQQVGDGEEAEPGELCRPVRHDAGQATQGCLQRRRDGAGRWHDASYSASTAKWESVFRVPCCGKRDAGNGCLVFASRNTRRASRRPAAFTFHVSRFTFYSF